MSFAETLKYLREENQITQKELANQCKLSPQCICNLEQGLRNPTGSTVAVLAQFFGVSADYLLGLEDDFGVRTAAPIGDTYSSEERKIIEQYRSLPKQLKKLVRDQLEVYCAPNELLSNTDKKV